MSSEPNEASAASLRPVGGGWAEPGKKDAPSATPWNPFWPIALTTPAFLAWTCFQTVQLYSESSALRATQAQQEPLVQNSTKLRQSLDAIAAQTQRLAEQGNPNAKSLVDDLRKRGVTINASTGAAATPQK